MLEFALTKVKKPYDTFTHCNWELQHNTQSSSFYLLLSTASRQDVLPVTNQQSKHWRDFDCQIAVGLSQIFNTNYITTINIIISFHCNYNWTRYNKGQHSMVCRRCLSVWVWSSLWLTGNVIGLSDIMCVQLGQVRSNWVISHTMCGSILQYSHKSVS